MSKRIYILLISLLCLSWCANADKLRGVYFKSKEVHLEQRTGIDLTREGAISYKGSFTISFDISFRDFSERYGTVFQLKERSTNHQIDLICKIDEFFPDLFVVADKKETQLQIGLSDAQKNLVNRWYKVQLSVNAKSGEIEMIFDGKTTNDKIDFPVNSKFDWTFGIVNRYGIDVDEVPPISIRNIRFIDSGELKYHWELDYSKKRMVKDSINGKVAEIINPSWVVEQHQRWKKKRTFEFAEMPQIAYQKETEEIYFVRRKQALTKYSLNSGRIINLEYLAGNPFYENAQQVFFDKNNVLHAYSEYTLKSQTFDEINRKWDNSYDTIAYLPKYWHHNQLIHPITGEYTTICGYGFFSYFNNIKSLNEIDGTWSAVEMKGDRIEPRYLASLGQSQKDKNVYYLFGGLGNSTGKQILGKEFYYDLYKIDFESNYISQVWKWESNLPESYTPINSMVINEDEQCFYTLCFSHSNNTSSLQLNKGSLVEPGWQFIGNKIPYYFSDITSFSDLYYWKTHNKLLTLTMHQREDGIYEVNLYSLNYPPSELVFAEAEVPSLMGSYQRNLAWVSFLLLVLGGVIFWRMQKRQKPKVLGENAVLQNNRVEPDNVELAKGKILTFGGFQVSDKTGLDITYRFSPTLKELFLLILLNTLDDNKGITSKKIQHYLWPDKPDAKAKNNRGVNIKKLRAILADVGNLSLSFDGSFWRISHGDNVFCDIEYIQKRLSETVNEMNFDTQEKLVAVLSRGNFLVNIESEWLDQLKDNITGKILSNLEERTTLLNVLKDEKRLLKIADLLFTFDQTNERALELKCSILNHQGKHALALEIYNHYTKLYQKLYKEDFKIPFKDIVK